MADATQPNKPDFRIHKIETTGYWSPSIRERAGKLFAVHIFDANRHTYVCELTPSYEMHYLGETWTEHVEDEDASEKLFNDILEGEAGEEEVLYIPVRNVDLAKCESIGTSDEDWASFLDDADGDEEKAWKACLEQHSEYCRGNGWVY